jgi:hypothetical protein
MPVQKTVTMQQATLLMHLLVVVVLLLQTSPGELNKLHFAGARDEAIICGCEPCLRNA